VISGCILEGRGIETMSKSATLMGVAEHAGVSTATVARVLKKNGYVKE
jgi:DNA-binding MurR/RpiR family transcriptional regulator